jgi:hypothetical protein
VVSSVDLIEGTLTVINDYVCMMNCSGDGGALAISNGIDTPSNNQYCCYDPTSQYSPQCPTAPPPAQYRAWSFNSSIIISNSTFLRNTASCKTCSGGAIAIQPGGDVSIFNCTIATNSAAFFGGGVFIGGPSPGYASCSLNLTGSVFESNSNSHSGGQLYSSCGGSIDFSGTTFELLNTVFEVRVHT